MAGYYYVSASLPTSDRPQVHGGMRVPAGDIEGLVLDRLRSFFSSKTDVGDALASLDVDANSFDAALRNASALSDRWLTAPPRELKGLVHNIVEQVILAADRIEPGEDRRGAGGEARVQGEPDLNPIVLSTEAKLRRVGRRKRLVIANGANAEDSQGLAELIKEALLIRNQLLAGPDDSIEATSARLGLNKCRLTSLVRLAILRKSAAISRAATAKIELPLQPRPIVRTGPEIAAEPCANSGLSCISSCNRLSPRPRCMSL